ncbi:MAG: stage 0 sporulation protein J [Chloroflexi bacterium]|nr:MAG: stage 0 sporulation protein J [Chloroflexota bacterium]
MGHTTPGRKRGLGRGLGALIRNTESLPPAAGGVRSLAVEQIRPNPRQPRTRFDETALAELAESIRTHGIIQPLIVTQSTEQPDTYYLVAGERRWRAARLAGLAEVPALVREASPSQLVEWALVENIQRADLNPLEEAAAYQTLMDELGLTQDEVADRVGKSRPAVGNTVRLLQLPLPYQEALLAGMISAGHARALLRLKEDPPAMEQALAAVMRQELNVRQTEALVNTLLAADTRPEPEQPEIPPSVHAHLAHLENRFRSILGTRVNLTRNANGSGRLVIHFYNEDDLAQLYELIAGSDEPE